MASQSGFKNLSGSVDGIWIEFEEGLVLLDDHTLTGLDLSGTAEFKYVCDSPSASGRFDHTEKARKLYSVLPLDENSPFPVLEKSAVVFYVSDIESCAEKRGITIGELKAERKMTEDAQLLAIAKCSNSRQIRSQKSLDSAKRWRTLYNKIELKHGSDEAFRKEDIYKLILDDEKESENPPRTTTNIRRRINELDKLEKKLTDKT